MLRKQDKSRFKWWNLKEDLIENFRNKVLGEKWTRGQESICIKVKKISSVIYEYVANCTWKGTNKELKRHKDKEIKVY